MFCQSGALLDGEPLNFRTRAVSATYQTFKHYQKITDRAKRILTEYYVILTLSNLALNSHWCLTIYFAVIVTDRK